MSFTTHPSVIRNLRDGKSEAWHRFFEIYAPLIRLHGKDCGIDENSLDDLVQNVMLSIFSSSSRFEYDPAKGRFRDYLRFIIRARANDMLRARYQRVNPADIPVVEECLDDLFGTEWEEHIRTESLKQLKKDVLARHYQIFHMLDVQNRNVKEVARFFRMSAASVYSIRNRTELKLRRIAEKLDI